MLPSNSPTVLQLAGKKRGVGLMIPKRPPCQQIVCLSVRLQPDALLA